MMANLTSTATLHLVFAMFCIFGAIQHNGVPS